MRRRRRIFIFFSLFLIILIIFAYENISKRFDFKWEINEIEKRSEIISKRLDSKWEINNLSKDKPITVEDVRSCLEINFSFFIENYKTFMPSDEKVQYYTIFPFHSNGIPKKDLNYREYFNDENVVINHYSNYISNKNDNDNSLNKILPRDLNEDEQFLSQSIKKKFTLIYLISITVPTKLILREIKAMSNPEVAFIIFINSKSNRTEIFELFSTIKTDENSFENVYFINSPRFQSEWGRITQILAQAVLMYSALKYFPDSLYLSFHSESEYPIVPPEIILMYLKKHYPANYMEILAREDQEFDKTPRVQQLSFIHVPHDTELISAVEYLFPKMSIPGFNWSHGANWFTMTLVDSRKIIDQILRNFSIIDHLDFCFHSDEVLFQTLVKEAKVATSRNYHRYIDWSLGGPSPRLLDEEEFHKIVADPCNFWARKFNINKSKKVLDMIDDNIVKIRNNKNYQMCQI